MISGTTIPRARRLMTGLIAILFTAQLASAQEAPIVKAIDVQYVGNQALSRERILSRMGTRVGDQLSINQIDADVKKLMSSGEVSNVKMLSNEVPGGVQIIVVIESRALYGGAAFEGNSVFPDRKLAKMVESPVNQPINASELRKARTEILTSYRRKGYPDATVSYDVTPASAKGYSKVIFRIEENAPGVLRRVRFAGNQSIPADELKEVMTQKEKSLQNVFSGWGRTDAASIEADARAIEQLYRNRGFFEAKVLNVEKIPVDSKHNDLAIRIEEGPRHGVSGVAVNGISSFSYEEELAPYLKTQSGKPFSSEDIKHDVELIQEFYRSRGYVDVEVVPRIE